MGPLRDGEMLALARALLGDDPSVHGVTSELVRRADGNPFFLEQLVITLIDDGSLEGTPGAYRLQKPFGELRVPGSIAAVIGARVDRLPDAAKSALEAASVVGDPVTRELIATMQGVDIARAEELLGLCLSSGLLTTPDQARSSLEFARVPVSSRAGAGCRARNPHPRPPQGVASPRVPRLAFAARCWRCGCCASARSSRLQGRGMGACGKICGQVDGARHLALSQSGGPATVRDGR